MNKNYIQVFDTVNKSPSIRMTITIFHGIHQNILQKVILIKKFQCCCTSRFAIANFHLHFQDYSTTIAQSIESFLLFTV